MKNYSLLFICTGNICRSPTFEGVFRKLLSDNNLNNYIFVDSAGIRDYHIGEPADRRSVEYANKRGYDLSMIRSRQVCSKDFIDFDLLLALDKSHYKELLDLSPKKYTSKIKLFLSYIGNESLQDVPDPYYGGREGFEQVLDMAEGGYIKLLNKLKNSI